MTRKLCLSIFGQYADNYARPELLAIPDPIDYSVEPHNSWMVNYTAFSKVRFSESNMPQNDGVMAYIDWAVNNGYAVIDVNMPMHIDDMDVCFPAGPIYHADISRQISKKKASSSVRPRWCIANV